MVNDSPNILLILGDAQAKPSYDSGVADTSDVNKTFLVKTKTKTKTSIFFQDQDQDFLVKIKTKTFSFKTKTKTKTVPGPLNRLPYHGHKMNKTVYTRHACNKDSRPNEN